jgi:phosphoenolpyruvate-protein kinase (PTS system EI component)
LLNLCNKTTGKETELCLVEINPRLNQLKMKISKLIPSVLVLSSVLFFTSCQSSAEKVNEKEEKVEEAQEELEKAEYQLRLDIDNFNKDKNIEIINNQKEILDLKTQVISGDLNKKEYAEQVADLEIKNDQLNEKMAAYSGEGQENWNNFKREFNADMEILKQALNDMATKNKKK